MVRDDATMRAEHLGVQPRHVQRLVAERRIPFIKWGHDIWFVGSEPSAWVSTGEKGRPGPRGRTLRATGGSGAG